MYGLPALSVKNPSSLWRNPLAFPAGRAPGFDPTHQAAKGIALSAIASAGNFICLDRSRAPATITGSFTAGIVGLVGPRATPGSLTSLAVISSTGLSAAGLATLAGIVVGAVNASVPAILLDSAGGVTDTALGTNTSTGALLFRSNSNNTSSTTIFLTAGTPYFIAASVKGASNINFIALNLLTGSVQTQAVATANVINAGTSLTIGNFNATQSRGWTQPIAAVMASSVYLSMSQLLQWAADPWSFWYPDKPQFDYGFAATILNLSILGQSLLNSQGSLNLNSNLAIAGQSLINSQGTLALNSNLSIVGQGLVNSQGQPVANSNLAVAGQSLTEAQGSVGISRATALLGLSATITSGTVTPAANVGIFGQSLSSSVGSVGLVKSLALAGQSVINSVGNLGVSKTLSLIGSSIGTFIGNLIAHVLIPLFPSKDRTLSVQAENRGFKIEPEVRGLSIEPENRTFGIDE